MLKVSRLNLKQVCISLNTALLIFTQHRLLWNCSFEQKPTIGPAIDRGFYYDFAMDAITESDLKPIHKKNAEIARKNLPVERIELSDGELKEHFAANPYKIEIINDKIGGGIGSTIYKQGDWYDLCLGPHVASTAKLMFCKLTSVSSAYWRGDQE